MFSDGANMSDGLLQNELLHYWISLDLMLKNPNQSTKEETCHMFASVIFFLKTHTLPLFLDLSFSVKFSISGPKSCESTTLISKKLVHNVNKNTCNDLQIIFNLYIQLKYSPKTGYVMFELIYLNVFVNIHSF